MKTYKCITTCTWNGRHWREGTDTPPLDDNVIPPEHFTENKDEDEGVSIEEATANDEIKRGGPGKWKLPNGGTFTGKLAEAKEYWEEYKNK